MENNNSNNSNLWYRFPIKVIDTDLHEDEITDDDWMDTHQDVRLDTIVSVRPWLKKQKDGTFRVAGSLIYSICGDTINTPVKPSTMKKILNYEPIVLKDEYTSTVD